MMDRETRGAVLGWAAWLVLALFGTQTLRAQGVETVDRQDLSLPSESHAINVVDSDRVIVAARTGVYTITRAGLGGEWHIDEHHWDWKGVGPRLRAPMPSVTRMGFLVDRHDAIKSALLVLGKERDGTCVLIRVDEHGEESERVPCGLELDSARMMFNTDHTALVVCDRKSGGVIVLFEDGKLQNQPLPESIHGQQMSEARLHVTPAGERFLIWQNMQIIRWVSLSDPDRCGKQRVVGWTNHIVPQFGDTSRSASLLSVITYGDFPGAKVYDFITTDEHPRLVLSERTIGGGSDESLQVQDSETTWIATVSIGAAPAARDPGLAWVRGSVGLRVDSGKHAEYLIVGRLTDDGGTRAIAHGGLGMHVEDGHGVIAAGFGTNITLFDVRVRTGDKPDP